MSKGLLIIVTLLASLFAAAPFNSANAQIYGTRASNRQVNDLLVRIETKTDTFKRMVQSDLDRSPLNGTNREDRISDFITNFETATDALQSQFNNRQSVNNEVQEVLNRAAFIDRFMTRNNLSYQTEQQWTSLRADLDSLARLYTISWNWSNANPNYGGNWGGGGRAVYTATDTQLSTLLTRIEQRTDTFRQQVDRGLDRGVYNGTTREDSIAAYVTEFENATDRLKRQFDDRRSTADDVNEVLTRATYIDQYIARNRALPYAARGQWRMLRTDLNTLATYYRVSWNWNQTLPPFTAGNYGNEYPSTGGRLDGRITGTYRLNRSNSDDVAQVVTRSINVYPPTDRERVQRVLERRLTSPDMLAIERSGRTVTIASSNAPQVSFDANGVAQSETNARGRVIRTTASLAGDTVTIAYEGDRTNDFYVTFMPVGNNQLRVTRRIYLENRNEQVTVTSVYDKIDNVAQWSTVNSGSTSAGNYPSNEYPTGTVGEFYIPNGTQVTARLRNSVDSKVSQVGDRFTLEVVTPLQYRGAVIEGRIVQADNSGRVSGRANLSFDFDTIRLINGQSYRFAGIIDSVRAANGDNVSVTNEGTVRDRNQTTRTVTRAGIGAALGALIGAIAGGGQGAAIGAAIGAGAGAGTVLIQGKDSVVLDQGSEFTITATGPNRVALNP
jgi:hypothetical protein